MIKALIIDDEKKAIVVLRKLLQEHCPDINVAGSARRVYEAVQMVEQENPQLLFLDIEMHGKSGFELLEKIRGRNIHVIFVTAHSEFALKAFRFSVADYLLKPVGIEELKQAVEKVKLLTAAFTGEITVNSKTEIQPTQTLRIPSTKGVIFAYLEHIIRVEAEGAYSHVYLDNGKHYLVSDYLKQLEKHLDPSIFMRVHRSHIINLEKIRSVISKHGLFAEMSDGSLIEVAKRNKADFIKIIHK